MFLYDKISCLDAAMSYNEILDINASNLLNLFETKNSKAST